MSAGKYSALRSLLASVGVASAAIPAAAVTPKASEDGTVQGGLQEGVEYITVAEATTATEAAMAASEKKGFDAANERMLAVMTSEAGKAQPHAAVHLLHSAPGMDAAACIGTLEKLAPAPAPAAEPAASTAAKVDLNKTPKIEIEPNASTAGAGDDVDANQLWDGIQGTKNGVREGGAGVLNR